MRRCPGMRRLNARLMLTLSVCSVALQHSWTYAPLVADVLGLSLNRISVPAAQEQPGAPAAQPKSYEVRLDTVAGNRADNAGVCARHSPGGRGGGAVRAVCNKGGACRWDGPGPFG